MVSQWWREISSSTILECKARATIAEICYDIPVEFANILIYTHSLAFAEDPDYDHLRSLLHGLRATLPAPATCLLDFGQPDGPGTPYCPAIHPLLSPDQRCMAEAMSICPPKAVHWSTHVWVTCFFFIFESKYNLFAGYARVQMALHGMLRQFHQLHSRNHDCCRLQYIIYIIRVTWIGSAGLNSSSLQMLEIVYCNGSNASCVIVHHFQRGTIFPSTCCTDSH